MKKVLLLMTALLFISGASMAQKVVNLDGKAIIDNRDMPAGAITKDKKARRTDATSDRLGTDDLTNLNSKESNKTVSHYFEVMKSDYDHNKAVVSWPQAFQNCVNYDSGDGDMTWRLPTQRELQLIFTLYESLKHKVTDFVSIGSSFTTYVWSATGHGLGNSWYVYTDYAITSSAPYLHTNLVRCVRDLTPPVE